MNNGINMQDFKKIHGAFFGYLKGYGIYAKYILEK
jgi:hypothetical protein